MPEFHKFTTMQTDLNTIRLMNNSSKNKLFYFLCQHKSSMANSYQIRQRSHSFTITSIILHCESKKRVPP